MKINNLLPLLQNTFPVYSPCTDIFCKFDWDEKSVVAEEGKRKAVYYDLK